MTDQAAGLSDAQVERYSRQIILPQVGGRGQQRLLAASVAVVGTGHASATAVAYLAAAGIGRLGASGDALGDALDALNPDCRIHPLSLPMTAPALAEVAGDYDVIVTDGATPLAAAAVTHGTPLVWGQTSGPVLYAAAFAGHLPNAPCYDCFRTPLRRLPTGTADLLRRSPLADVVSALVGTLLAVETIKIVLGMDRTLIGRLICFDALDGAATETAIAKDPRCPTCTRDPRTQAVRQ